MLTHFYHSVTRLRSLNLLIAASFAMLLGACSSTTSESRLVLNLPDWQKLHKETAAKQNKISSSAISDEAEIEFLSIKVSGSGLPQPLTELWKHKDGESPKMQASFVIPRGTSVLVQVLAVYGGNVSTEFYYGDNTVNADKEIVGAEIKLELANVTGTVEGNIVGRYMDSANHGPTGVFEYHFDPDSMPGGKPSMVVTTGEIFGGWLRAFHLNSRLLQYKWPNGHFVFDPSDDAQLFSATQPMRSARILVPRGFRINGSDNEEQSLQTVTAGFFGPGASSEHLCLQPAGANVEELYDVATASPSAKFKWSAHSTPAPGEEGKTVRVIDPDLAGANYDKGGDLNSACAANSGGVEYSTYLKFNQDKIASGDEVLDFRGPFRKLASGKFLGRSHDISGQRAILTWSFLPGADTDLDGVSVFWRRMPATGYNDDDIRGDDGYRCADFRNLGAFTPSFNEINLANNAFSAQIPSIATEAESQLIQAVVCPRLRDGSLSSSGISTDSGGGANAANHLLILLPGQTYTAGTVVGIPQVIRANNDTTFNVLALRPNNEVDTSFNGPLSSYISGGTYSTVSTSINFVNGQASVTLNYPNSTPEIHFEAQSSGLTNASSPNFFVEPNTPGTPLLSFYAMNTWWTAGRCEPILLTFNNPSVSVSGGTAINALATTAPVTVNLDVTGGSTATYYSNAECTGPSTSSILVPAGSRGILVGVIVDNPSSPTFLRAQAPGFQSASYDSDPHTATAQGAATTAYVFGRDTYFKLLQHFSVGTCQPIAVGFTDGIGSAVIPAPTTFAFANSSNMSFHTDSNCTGPAAPSMLMPANMRGQIYYVRMRQAGTVSSAFTTSNDRVGAMSIGPSTVH